MVNRPVRDHEILSAVFAKMDVPAMTVAAGVLSSLVLFFATAVLLLQTVPENYPVGPHEKTVEGADKSTGPGDLVTGQVVCQSTEMRSDRIISGNILEQEYGCCHQ